MPKRAVALLSLALVFSLFLPASAQKKGKTRPLTTKQLMAGLVKPQLVAVQEGLKAGPKTDEDWAALATSAALLNESGYLMMDDHRCPDEIWKTACEELKTGSTTLAAAIEKRDAAAATEHVALVIKSCKTCHAEHKYKKKP